MPLPFRERPQLPNNKHLATVRLRHLKGKMDKNPKYKKDYVQFMVNVFKDGDAEEVHATPKDGNTWYIPHHGVYHPRKPEKIRVVFDCSAKYEGTSLNDHLLTGPDLTNTLTGVLCRFRQYPIAINCDVEKMFHRFPVFVANRIQKIRDATDPNRWFYIETTQNPADHASRGLKVADLMASDWLRGPKFLWEQEIVTNPMAPELLIGDPEVEVLKSDVTSTLLLGG
ncbi:uncharacterized protein LOC133418464 [Cololabis saira]|uniref:uncharacterized protein LOC133418464 n=1 Tax=Cololabis saira TaxID=129043 RepID=UPI002AD38706|nr:uncharacterized protein LOC133418464 [Cololabis saira]